MTTFDIILFIIYKLSILIAFFNKKLFLSINKCNYYNWVSK